MGGNTVTNSSDRIVLAIGPGSPAGALTCSGGATQQVNAGVATFNGCTITGTAGTYTLTATDADDPSLTVTSASFTITLGPPARLAFTIRNPAVALAGSHGPASLGSPSRMQAATPWPPPATRSL